MAAGVIIWEWQNEYGSWRPYSPQISSFLEANKNAPNPVPLGSVDQKLYQYQIDFQNFCQIRHGTGTQRPVRRSVLPSSSPLAKGITWQWEGDALGTWCDFDIHLIEYLDECFTKGQTFIDLSKSKFFLPYHVDLKAMTQTRIETGRVRNIQRVFTSTSYPKDLSSPLSTASKRSAGGNSAIMSSGATKKLHISTAVSAPTVTTTITTTTTASGFTLGSGLFGGNSQFLNSHMFSTNLANVPGAHSSQVLPGSQFSHTHHGPLTRTRYRQSMSSTLQTNQSASGSVATTTNQSVTSTMTSAYSSVQSHNPLLSHSGSPYLTGAGIGHFQPGMFHHQGTGNNLGPGLVPSFGGFPGSLFGVQQSAAGSSSSLPQPNIFSHGSLNPAHLFAGARTKIRPSQGASSSQGTGFGSGAGVFMPTFDRIPNYASKSSRKNNSTSKSGSAAETILHNYVDILKSPPADDDCCICCERLIEASGHGSGTPEDHVVYKLEKCSHMFHKLCLTAMYESGAKDGHVQCPTCKTIYGEKMGNCPKGEMEYKIIDHELAGYQGHKTIQIVYIIHSGTQGPEHPHPGKRYTARGFPRVGYLPDCDKGRKVLQLLIIAWKRRLTFTIGSSTTTGENDTVTWNEIHHKTELGTNYSGHGYPDPKYLDNVLQELAVHGITEKDISPE